MRENICGTGFGHLFFVAVLYCLSYLSYSGMHSLSVLELCVGFALCKGLYTPNEATIEHENNRQMEG